MQVVHETGARIVLSTEWRRHEPLFAAADRLVWDWDAAQRSFNAMPQTPVDETQFLALFQNPPLLPQLFTRNK